MRSYNPTTSGHKGQIKRALQTLVAAKKPVVYVGGGAITAGCHLQLKEAVEALNLPVVSSLMGLGAFPATHRRALGMLGMHGTYEANMTMHNADVIFAVGVRFDDRTTNNLAKYCPNATVLHIDIDPTSISKTVTADIPIVGMLAGSSNKCLNSCRKNPPINRWMRSATGGSRLNSGALVSA